MLIWTGKKSDFSGEDKEAMHVSQQGCITETWFVVPWSNNMIEIDSSIIGVYNCSYRQKSNPDE